MVNFVSFLKSLRGKEVSLLLRKVKVCKLGTLSKACNKKSVSQSSFSSYKKTFCGSKVSFEIAIHTGEAHLQNKNCYHERKKEALYKTLYVKKALYKTLAKGQNKTLVIRNV